MSTQKNITVSPCFVRLCIVRIWISVVFSIFQSLYRLYYTCVVWFCLVQCCVLRYFYTLFKDLLYKRGNWQIILLGQLIGLSTIARIFLSFPKKVMVCHAIYYKWEIFFKDMVNQQISPKLANQLKSTLVPASSGDTYWLQSKRVYLW